VTCSTAYHTAAEGAGFNGCSRALTLYSATMAARAFYPRAILAFYPRAILVEPNLCGCFGSNLYTADAMRPLPSFLLLCASYGGTAIEYGLSSGQYGLDYCIAAADTTSGMMAAPTCTLPWTSLAPFGSGSGQVRVLPSYIRLLSAIAAAASQLLLWEETQGGAA